MRNRKRKVMEDEKRERHSLELERDLFGDVIPGATFRNLKKTLRMYEEQTYKSLEDLRKMGELISDIRRREVLGEGLLKKKRFYWEEI